MLRSLKNAQRERELQDERPANPAQISPGLVGTIPSESIRHLCLATAGIGAVYWLALLQQYPAGLLLVLISGWIVARALGALRNYFAAVAVSAAFAGILLVADLPQAPAAQHGLAGICPFPAQVYLGMLVALMAADALDLAQPCLHFRNLRSRWAWQSRHLESPGRAT